MAKHCNVCGCKIGFLDQDYAVPDGVVCFKCHEGDQLETNLELTKNNIDVSEKVASSQPIEASLLIVIGWLGAGVTIIATLVMFSDAKYDAEKWAAISGGFMGFLGSLVLVALGRMVSLLCEIRNFSKVISK